uniref:Putative serine protease inhibitor i/ii n=1 Tax=Corethrella appendiculata TaxID=1370023 RepID=U5EWN5_9DIPT
MKIKMKILLFGLFFITVNAVVAEVTSTNDQVCEPNSVFQKECNTCRCSPDGKLVSCTRKFCIPEPSGNKLDEVHPGPKVTDDTVTTTPQPNTQVCTPNEVRMEDCNRCKCAANGIGWFCTRKACPPKMTKRDTELRQLDPSAANFSCTPKETFKYDCNTCTCTDDGKHAACTIMFCLPARRKRQTELPQLNPYAKDFTCKPGQSFKHECNTCFCNKDGKTAGCTYMYCLPEMETLTKTKREVKLRQLNPHAPGFTCTPKEVFKYECSTCTCDDDGVSASCKLTPCLPKSDLCNPDLPQLNVENPQFTCRPGQIFKYEVNTCICGANGKSATNCTYVDCYSNDDKENKFNRHLLKREAPGCVPGTSFTHRDGCNACFCTSTGVAACTQKFCIKTGEIKSTRVKRETQDCVPGTSFKDADGCNDCFCTPDGKAACTEKYCIKEEKTAGKNKRETELRQLDPTAPNFSCTPKETFKYDCNTCFCNNDGKTAGCTYKACPKYKRETRLRDLDPLAPDFSCEPNEEFNFVCNTCFCSEDGITAVCTIKACLEPVIELRELDPTAPDFSCLPNETFKFDCNSCRCNDDGKTAACTLMLCPPDTKHETELRQLDPTAPIFSCNPACPKFKQETRVRELDPFAPDFSCEPNEQFNFVCNMCFCGTDGKTPLCTIKACPPSDIEPATELRELDPTAPGFSCLPNETFKFDCNSCRCNDDGKTAACTLMLCPPDTKHETELRQLDPTVPNFSCNPKETFKYDCNTCHCTDDGKTAACTAMACPPRSKRKTKDCEPGTTFKDDCNECFCTNDGHKACTEMACEAIIPQHAKREAQQPEKQQCIPGTRFKDENDCNECFCSENGFRICTKKFCLNTSNRIKRDQPQQQIPNTPGFTCTPKSTFKYECNTCRCSEDGKTAACTFRLCALGESRKKRQVAPYDPNFSCEPGSTFKWECNDCTCNPEGTSAVCSAKFCPPGEN